MPHKEGHWGYKTRKKIQDKVSNIGKNIKNKSKLLIDKGKKTVENINPNSEINKKINEKKKEVAISLSVPIISELDFKKMLE